MIYMSTKDTGQIIDIELPMGIIVAMVYLICCGLVFYKNKKTTINLKLQRHGSQNSYDNADFANVDYNDLGTIG